MLSITAAKNSPVVCHMTLIADFSTIECAFHFLDELVLVVLKLVYYVQAVLQMFLR